MTSRCTGGLDQRNVLTAGFGAILIGTVGAIVLIGGGSLGVQLFHVSIHTPSRHSALGRSTVRNRVSPSASSLRLAFGYPCALGLATPMSIMVGVGGGAQAGVLIKNAEALERMERIDTLVVDKTGTLTQGKLKVVAV